MHQTQFSQKIPYGGFSQIRSHIIEGGEYRTSIFKMLSKSHAPGTVPHRLHVYGSFRQVHGVSGHVTLHFEFQLRILEVRHSLSSLYYILLM